MLSLYLTTSLFIATAVREAHDHYTFNKILFTFNQTVT